MISGTVISFLAYSSLARCTFFGSMLWVALGLPPIRPRVRAACRPACVLCRMISRSISARAPKRWNVNLPPGVDVSMLSVRLKKLISRACKSITVSIRCFSERPKRSSRQTTMVSPGRANFSISKNWGLSSFAPLVKHIATQTGGIQQLGQEQGELPRLSLNGFQTLGQRRVALCCSLWLRTHMLPLEHLGNRQQDG